MVEESCSVVDATGVALCAAPTPGGGSAGVHGGDAVELTPADVLPNLDGEEPRDDRIEDVLDCEPREEFAVLLKVAETLEGLSASFASHTMAITEGNKQMQRMATSDERKATAKERQAQVEVLKLQMAVFPVRSPEHTEAQMKLLQLSRTYGPQ
mmetsp:Transcript_17356/g.48345  ORF Transcript_17356/g.48345 Transcript_17356/m.48345 type:complete len:154 (-) Transcript_17356:330-791(-)